LLRFGLVEKSNNEMINFNSNLLSDSNIQSAEGPWVLTKSGEKLFDLSLGSGTLIFGHAHLPKEIFDTPLMLPEMTSDLVDELNHLVCDSVPFRVGGVGLQTSGALAVERAIRLARVLTGRELVAVIGNFFHGSIDPFLFSYDSSTKRRYMLSDGIPDAATSLIRHYSSVDQFLTTAKLDQFACLLVETRQGANPEQRILTAITESDGREKLRENGVLLILDEIICGFRTNYGCSIEGASSDPDIVVFGKPIGMGYPVGLVVARRFDKLKTDARRFIWGGTFSASPLQLRCVTWSLTKLKLICYSELTSNLDDIVELLENILHGRARIYSGGGFARLKVESQPGNSARAFLDKGLSLRSIQDQLTKHKMFVGQNGLIFASVNNIKNYLGVS